MDEIEPQNGTAPADGETQSEPPPSFLVVALGASAGGLNALQQFFERMPPDSGMAFVVMMHLAPDYESHLAALLQGFTQMPVQQVNEPIALQPNQVFVAPPNRNLFALGDHLGLAALEEQRSDRAPIDYFFRTLASTLGARAICVVLSGSGSDGTLGLRHVKEVGGLTVAQDPADAEYGAMPQSAIATGQVELILPAAQIAARLVEYARTAKHEPALTATEEEPAENASDLIQEILDQVRAGSGYDFGTLQTVNHPAPDPQAHADLWLLISSANIGISCTSTTRKCKSSLPIFLISVTNFFRDAEAFTALEREVIPGLFRNKQGEDQVRVWVTGCATGEEAYSMGILLLEYAQSSAAPAPHTSFCHRHQRACLAPCTRRAVPRVN